MTLHAQGSQQLGHSGGTETRDGNGGTETPGRNRRKRQRGEFKIMALAAFENRGWLSPPAWAVLTGRYPVRTAYSYIKRCLWKWRLVDRRLDPRGLLVYRLNQKGADRLAWLRARRGNR